MDSKGTFDVIHEVVPVLPVINQPIIGPISHTVQPLPALAEWAILLEGIAILLLLGGLAFVRWRQRRSW